MRIQQRRRRRPSQSTFSSVKLLLIAFLVTVYSKGLLLQQNSSPLSRTSRASTVFNASSSGPSPKNVTRLTPEQIFMAVKTTPKNYPKRVQSILATYWKLAPRSVVFFTDSSSTSDPILQDAKGVQNQWKLRRMEESPLEDPSKDSFILVDTGCGGSHSSLHLRCKTAAEITYYVRHKMETTPWFCQFDDDTFVNVPNLLSYLSEFDADSELLYIGRQRGVKTKVWGTYETFRFAPGAAWCLSRALVRLGRALFEDMGRPDRPYPGADDLVVAYIVQKKLNVTMVNAPLMNSHLESQHFASRSEMQGQLTYGAGGYRNFNFPSYPGFLFVSDKGGPPEDPMGFRGLFCNLWPDQCRPQR